MTPEEIRVIIEAAVKKTAGMSYLQFTLLAAITSAASFFGAYFQEKAKSTVTKRDIGEITRKIEEVKRELEQRDRIVSKKYELKYNACLNMLRILDARLSCTMTTDNKENPIHVDRQNVTSEEVRQCHNALLLTINTPEINTLFMNVMLGQSKHPLKDLNQIRRLVRKELGFGDDFHLDNDRTWFASQPNENS